ncbi:MAG: tetratricopeptide repeat protein [Kofleriaceae bacterium]
MRLVVSTILCATLCQTAFADPAADTALQDGRRHYDLREWDLAIQKFKTAYRLTPSREALFNLAQTYRQKGDCKEAVGTYKTYLRNYPKATNRARVEGFIDELGDCPEPVLPPEPEATKTPIPVAHVTVEPPKRSHPIMRVSSYLVGGLGLVGVVATAKFALDGQAAGDDLTEACLTSCTPELVRELRDRGDAANRNAWISLGAGTALLAGAAALFVFSRDGASETRAVSIVPSRDGIHATWAVTF